MIIENVIIITIKITRESMIFIVVLGRVETTSNISTKMIRIIN